jgi:hypothetical protein
MAQALPVRRIHLRTLGGVILSAASRAFCPEIVSSRFPSGREVEESLRCRCLTQSSPLLGRLEGSAFAVNVAPGFSPASRGTGTPASARMSPRGHPEPGSADESRDCSCFSGCPTPSCRELAKGLKGGSL